MWVTHEIITPYWDSLKARTCCIICKNIDNKILKKLLDTRMVAALKTLKAHCCYLRASVGIGMAILPLEGIYPQIKRVKVLFKTKTNNLPLICNSTFQTGRQCL